MHLRDHQAEATQRSGRGLQHVEHKESGMAPASQLVQHKSTQPGQPSRHADTPKSTPIEGAG